MSLLTDRFIKNSHIDARSYSIFVKSVLKQTWNAFTIKFQVSEKIGKAVIK